MGEQELGKNFVFLLFMRKARFGISFYFFFSFFFVARISHNFVLFLWNISWNSSIKACSKVRGERGGRYMSFLLQCFFCFGYFILQFSNRRCFLFLKSLFLTRISFFGFQGHSSFLFFYSRTKNSKMIFFSTFLLVHSTVDGESDHDTVFETVVSTLFPIP